MIFNKHHLQGRRIGLIVGVAQLFHIIVVKYDINQIGVRDLPFYLDHGTHQCFSNSIQQPCQSP